MLLKLGPQPAAAQRLAASADLHAMVEAVAHDHGLLRERVRRLTGAAGLARLDAALGGIRAAVAAEHADAPAPPLEPLPAGGLGSGSSTDTDSSLPSSRAGSVIGPATPEKTPQRRLRPASGGDDSDTAPSGGGASAPRRHRREGEAMRAAGAGAATNDAGTGIPDGVEGRLALVWELLHDPTWRLRSADVEAAWDDALGRSSVMTVSLSLT